MTAQIAYGRDAKTALSYWLPRLEAAGLPVPRTVLVDMPQEARDAMIAAFDDKDCGDPSLFFNEIACVANAVGGYPVFLRTDYTSAKHDWRRSCYVASREEIPSHVFTIVEHSEMADMIGLDWRRWAVREYLPVKPYGTCPLYRDMPICKEFRCFVEDDEMLCIHSYWPRESLERGGAHLSDDQYRRLCDTERDLPTLVRLATKAGGAIGGSWSVDILETARGWIITDMAEADRSFHWPDCPNAEGSEEPLPSC